MWANNRSKGGEMTEKDELFEKDGFTMTMEQKFKGHPIKFTQWEARYVSHLEEDNGHLKKLVQHQRNEISWERDRYIRQITEDKTDQKVD